MRTDVFSRAARLTAATGLALAVSSVGLATAAGATAAPAPAPATTPTVAPTTTPTTHCPKDKDDLQGLMPGFGSMVTIA